MFYRILAAAFLITAFIVAPLRCATAKSKSTTNGPSKYYVWNVLKAGLDVKLGNEGFSEKGILDIRAVGLAISINTLCGNDYVEQTTESSIHIEAEHVGQKHNIPYPLVLKEAKKFASVTVDEHRHFGDTLSFCRGIKASFNSQH